MSNYSRSVFLCLLSCFLLTMITPAPAGAETVPDSLQVARLADLGWVWGTGKYFHPWLTYRDIDWDAAGAAAVTQVLEAEDAAAYAAAVQSLLAALEDPASRVVEHPRNRYRTDDIPFIEWLPDSVLAIDLSRRRFTMLYRHNTGMLRELQPDIKRAKGLLIDLRSGMANSYPETFLRMLKLNETLLDEPLAGPGERTRFHRGFQAESTRLQTYHSGFRVGNGSMFPSGDGDSDLPVVFLVNANCVIPKLVPALQQVGRAAVVAEGEVGDASLVERISVTLSDNVEVKLRLGELVYADGTTGFRPNLQVEAGVGDGDPARERGLEMLRSRDYPPSTREPLTAAVSPPTIPDYGEETYPTVGYRVLAAFKVWTLINYLFPYYDLMDGDWDAVLVRYLPEVIAAESAREYHLAITAMYAHINDSHGGVYSSILSEEFGNAPCALFARRLEGQVVVTGFRDDKVARAAGVEVGDVILARNGERTADLVERVRPYINASTPQAFQAVATSKLLTGVAGETISLLVRRGDRDQLTLDIPCDRSYWRSPQRGGEVFRALDDRIGYADLDRLTVPQVSEMFKTLADKRAIILDMRGYPLGTFRELPVWLAEEVSPPAARFNCPLRLSPDESGRQFETFIQHLQAPRPNVKRFTGKTVMLMDESSVSQAEHIGLALKAANNTVFIGSPTNGANGDITLFRLPGGLTLYFTGQAVEHVDGRPLQRVGLKPDIEVNATIAGLRAGRDEVLEAAIAYLNGELGD
ncbi:MAG: hypothetical protein GY835_01730 [bacterium]|nr:hypothetical protein [bacterium]